MPLLHKDRPSISDLINQVIINLNTSLIIKTMAALYHIEERTTTGWHYVDQARIPMPKDVCHQAWTDLINDGADPGDLRIVRDR